MFTSQAPQLLQALGKVTDENNARQVTQAVANCSQEIKHRGRVSLAGMPFAESNGMVSSSPWGQMSINYFGIDGIPMPAEDALRPGGGLAYVNINSPFEMPPPGGGYRGGDWFTYQGDNNTFDVAPRITEQTNFYYGAPTFQSAGNSVFNYVYGDTGSFRKLRVKELESTQVNGVAVNGDQGDPGVAGPAGAPGGAGDPGPAGGGRNGRDGVGRPGRDGRDLVGFGPNPVIQIQIQQQIIQQILGALASLRVTIEDDCTVTVTSDYPQII